MLSKLLQLLHGVCKGNNNTNKIIFNSINFVNILYPSVSKIHYETYLSYKRKYVLIKSMNKASTNCKVHYLFPNYQIYY